MCRDIRGSLGVPQQSNSGRGDWFHSRRKEKPRRSGAEVQTKEKFMLRADAAMDLYGAIERGRKDGPSAIF